MATERTDFSEQLATGLDALITEFGKLLAQQQQFRKQLYVDVEHVSDSMVAPLSPTGATHDEKFLALDLKPDGL